MEGWRVASTGPGPLPRKRGSALAQGCDRGGRVVLPLARAAAVSTGLRIRGSTDELLDDVELREYAAVEQSCCTQADLER